MPDQFDTYGKPRPTSAMRHVAITTGTLTDVCDAIYCEADGTITVTDSAGNALAYVMVRGDRLDFRAATFSVGSGTFRAWYL